MSDNNRNDLDGDSGQGDAARSMIYHSSVKQGMCKGHHVITESIRGMSV